MLSQSITCRHPLFTSLLVLCLGFCLLVSAAAKAQSPSIKGDIMKTPETLGPFSLTDQNGHEFAQPQLQGKWSLLYFGFTNCGHICPVHMLQISKFYRQLEQLPALDAALPQVIFVSVDPARDTQERIKQYVEGFHPDFTGITGSETEIKKLESFLSAQHRANLARNGNYQVDHSSLLYLINPQQQLVASFYPPFYIDALVQDYRTVLGNARQALSRSDTPAATHPG